MWTLVFPGSLYRGLREALFVTAPRENGCFLLARHYRTRGSSALLASEIEAPGEGSWNRAGPRSLEPSSAFVNRCAVKAEAKGCSLIFVHTRPGARRAAFSSADRESNSRLFENLSRILPDRPLCSVVLGQEKACGAVYDADSGLDEDVRIKAVGSSITELSQPEPRDGAPARFDRQVRALGSQTQARLQGMSITIVGTGGTGSAVAAQLARMGAGRLRLIDRDTLDETNLPRVYGAVNSDVGRPKADVVGEHVSAFSNGVVEAVCRDVSDEGAWRLLADSDAVFGCTDNLTSRCVINEFSYRHLVPFIDAGCRIRLDASGGVSQAVAKVQTVTPDGPCLWCTGTLDGKAILQESFSDKERARLAREGYADGVEKQPSVVSLTTMAASMAVNQLLGMMGAFGDDHATRRQAEIKDGFALSDSPAAKDGCVCSTHRGVPFAEARAPGTPRPGGGRMSSGS